jgi:hypothetical protein
LTIGPAFLSGSIYLCLSRIIVAHGQDISRFSPRTYTTIFMSCDFVSLVLQGAGGGLAASADDKKGSDAGKNVMIAGMVFQVISLSIFMGLWLEFILRLRKTNESKKNMLFVDVTESRRFKWFAYGRCHNTAPCQERRKANTITAALWIATILIFIRSVYRIAELQGGFHGSIANNEALFMIFEGPMIILACFAVTLVHPGFAFAGRWSAAAWSLRGRKGDLNSEGLELISGKSSV